MRPFVALALCTIAAPASAQRVELTPTVSYGSSASFDQTAAGVSDLTVEDGIVWGGQATYFLTSHLGLGGLFTYRSSGLRMSTPSGSAELFRMTTNELHGHVVYEFGSAASAWRPFVTGGAGAAFFDAPGLQGETKASWTVGGGLTWFVRQKVGVQAQVRYTPAVLSDTSASVCDPFGFCQGSLRRVDIAFGTAFRF